MSCIKSFSFLSNFGGNLSNTPPFTLDLWGASPRISWAYQQKDVGSTINIQGFKNINIHGIKAQGNAYTNLLNSGNSIVVDDWNFYLQLNGQSPLLGANVVTSPNTMAVSIQGRNPVICLSKFNTEINLIDPITSVTSIQLLETRMNGTSAQNLTTINLGWFVNFIVYYSFEGEDEEFAFL